MRRGGGEVERGDKGGGEKGDPFGEVGVEELGEFLEGVEALFWLLFCVG